MRGYGTAFWMLMALAFALFAVGFAGHTQARHLIQAAPCAVAMLLILTGAGEGRRFAAGIFLIWILVVALIWLHLLNIVHVIDGDFPAIERVLSLVIGAVSLAGAVAAFRVPPRHFKTWVLYFLLGAAGQVVALQLSFGPLFAGR
jgi:hypothetical protein